MSKENSIELLISPEVANLLENRLILVEDVREVIAHAEATGEKIQNTLTGRYLASHRPTAVRYWVEYTALETGFVVHNAYCHMREIS